MARIIVILLLLLLTQCSFEPPVPPLAPTITPTPPDLSAVVERIQYAKGQEQQENRLQSDVLDMLQAVRGNEASSVQAVSINQLSRLSDEETGEPKHPWQQWADEHPAGEPPEAAYIWNTERPFLAMPAAMASGAYGVIQCESRHDERAYNKSSGTAGLFQIHPIHRNRAARMGYAWEQMLEAQPNTDVAASIFEEQGFGPWSCKPTWFAVKEQDHD